MPTEQDSRNQAQQQEAGVALKPAEKAKWHEKLATKIPERVKSLVAQVRRHNETNPRTGLEAITQLTELDPITKRLQADTAGAEKKLGLQSSPEPTVNLDLIKKAQPTLYERPEYLIWASQKENMNPELFKKLLNNELSPREQGHYAQRFAKQFPSVYEDAANSGIFYKILDSGIKIAAPEDDPELYRIHSEAIQDENRNNQSLNPDYQHNIHKREQRLIKEWIAKMTPEKTRAYAKMDKDINAAHNVIAEENIARRLLTEESIKENAHITDRILLRETEAQSKREQLEKTIPSEVPHNKPLLEAYAKTIPENIKQGIPTMDTREGSLEALALLQNAYKIRTHELNNYSLKGYLQKEDNRQMQMAEENNERLRDANTTIYEITRRALDTIVKKGNNQGTTIVSALLQDGGGISSDTWKSILDCDKFTQDYIRDIEKTKIPIDLTSGRSKAREDADDIKNDKTKNSVKTNIDGLFNNATMQANTVLEYLASKLLNGYEKFSRSDHTQTSVSAAIKDQPTSHPSVASQAEQQVMDILKDLDF